MIPSSKIAPMMVWRTCVAIVGVVVGIASAHAATPGGSIEGRVFNRSSGGYLENARILVEGTVQETFTDDSGYYRFANVPSGEVRVRVFYTGLVPQVSAVVVSAGQRARQDFTLVGFDQPGGTVKLETFVVSTSKEMDAAAIAINEQRFAPNFRNVVAADEFGPVADAGVGEVLKFIPGVSVEYNAGNPRGVAINGVASDNVPLTVNGFDMASAQNNFNNRRVVDLMLVSTNNVSRMEVVYSPTPESQGMALAGSVNMVTRSAFEFTKPRLKASTYLFIPDHEKHFDRTPSPRSERTYKINPGFDFSYIVPVNDRFGFSVSAVTSRQYQITDFRQSEWRGAGLPTNGTTFPHTTPDRPYLTSFLLQDSPKTTTRTTLGATLDFKLTPQDRLSFSIQNARITELFYSGVLTFNVGGVAPGNFSPTFTRGSTGLGLLNLSTGGIERVSTSVMPTLTYRHDGAVWKAEGGVAYSHSVAHQRNISKGRFTPTTVRRTGVTVSFEDINYLRPGEIIVRDGATGAPVDPYSLSSYALISTVGGSNGDGVAVDTDDVKRSAYANLARYFHWRIPVRLKGGLDFRQSIRDHRTWDSTYNFVGADGRPSATLTPASDDVASVVLDPAMSSRNSAFGFPRFERVSNERMYELFKTNASYFVKDENAAHRSAVNGSRHPEEIVSAAYIRGDVQFYNNRLKIIGGVRAEQTNVKAEGPLTDVTRNYRRDANGRVLTGPTGQPLLIATDPVAVARLTVIDRGLRAKKEYLRYFPSLNVSYNLSDNLIARAAYFHSIGRPNFNQYAGGLQLPDTELPPGPNNQISVNNAGVKAWSAKSGKVMLEYYFERLGLISVGAFRRDIENFFGNTVFRATPELLALYGLDPGVLGAYNVSTTQNIPTPVRMEGVDVNYKQALTFLPPWARGVQVFGNGSMLRALGDESANFANYVPRTASWGISLTRPKYVLRANWNYRGRNRGLPVAAGPSIEPGTFNWTSKKLFIDLSGEYQLTKHFALFGYMRNVNNEPEDMERAGPSTPPHAQMFSRSQFNALWTFGVKASF